MAVFETITHEAFTDTPGVPITSRVRSLAKIMSNLTREGVGHPPLQAGLRRGKNHLVCWSRRPLQPLDVASWRRRMESSEQHGPLPQRRRLQMAEADSGLLAWLRSHPISSPPQTSMSENPGWPFCCCGRWTMAAPGLPRRRTVIGQALFSASPAALSVASKQTLPLRPGFKAPTCNAPYLSASPPPITRVGRCRFVPRLRWNPRGGGMTSQPVGAPICKPRCILFRLHLHRERPPQLRWTVLLLPHRILPPASAAPVHQPRHLRLPGNVVAPQHDLAACKTLLLLRHRPSIRPPTASPMLQLLLPPRRRSRPNSQLQASRTQPSPPDAYHNPCRRHHQWFMTSRNPLRALRLQNRRGNDKPRWGPGSPVARRRRLHPHLCCNPL